MTKGLKGVYRMIDDDDYLKEIEVIVRKLKQQQQFKPRGYRQKGEDDNKGIIRGEEIIKKW